MRKLIIFGNGLGMALDKDYFRLDRALQEVWASDQFLRHDDKVLINLCRGAEEVVEDISAPPRGENELNNLQRVVAACDVIAEFDGSQESDVGWLTEQGKRFPYAIRSFIHGVASSFQSKRFALPNEFFDPLLKYVLKERCHIATLNYDDLLYRSFMGTTAFSGYSGLVDGFLSGDFSPANLDRSKKHQTSYYLHLHGSPLYLSRQSGVVEKVHLRDISQYRGNSTTHVVLTHVSQKRAVINASKILSEYWKRLEEAIEDVGGIILFGYSGQDNHLNELVSQKANGRQIEVIEWAGENPQDPDSIAKRQTYWKQQLGTGVAFLPLQNILKHKDWEWVQPTAGPF